MQKIWYDEKGFARCGKCNRLLYKCVSGERPAGVEIKCHSCKELNVSEPHHCSGCRWYQHGVCMNEYSEHSTEICEKNDYCEGWCKK